MVHIDLFSALLHVEVFVRDLACSYRVLFGSYSMGICSMCSKWSVMMARVYVLLTRNTTARSGFDHEDP